MSDLFAELFTDFTLSATEQQQFAALDHEAEIASQRAALLALQQEHAQALIEFGVVGRAIIHTEGAPTTSNATVRVYRQLRRTTGISTGQTAVSSLEIGGIRLADPDNIADAVDVPIYSRRDGGDIQSAGRYLIEEAEMVAGMTADLALRAELHEFMLRPDLTDILDPGHPTG